MGTKATGPLDTGYRHPLRVRLDLGITCRGARVKGCNEGSTCISRSDIAGIEAFSSSAGNCVILTGGMNAFTHRLPKMSCAENPPATTLRHRFNVRVGILSSSHSAARRTARREASINTTTRYTRRPAKPVPKVRSSAHRIVRT